MTALWAAQALSDEDYFSLVKARGQAMATPDDPSVDVGTMLAVTGDALQVEDVIKQYPQVNIANFNSNKQIVLAGVKSELVKVQQTLTEKGASTVWLPVSAAFHTPLVGHAQKPFAKAVDAVTFQKAKVPVFTNVTGNCYPAQPELMSKVLKEHLINPVLFKREIENIYGQGGYCFIEFGPRSVLTHLVKEILSDRPHVAVALNASRQKDSDRQLREAAVQLRVAGLPLKNLDPFQLEQKLPTVQKSKLLNIRLGASNHVSDKTRKAFEDALQDDHKVTLTAPQPQPKLPPKEEVATGTNGNGTTEKSHIDSPRHSVSPSPRLLPRVNTTEHEALPVTQPIMSASGSNTVDKAQAKPTSVPTQPTAEPEMPLKPEMPLHYHQRVLESLEYTLAQFNQQQGGLLQVHEQSLHHQMEYIKAFLQLTQQQNVLFGNGQSAPQQETTNFGVQESSERSMMRFHDHQAETLRVHEQFLSHQMEHLTSLFQFMQQQYSSVLMNGSSPVNGNLTLNVSSTPTNGNSTPTNGSSTYERLMSTQLAASIASQQYNGNGNGKSNGNGNGKGHPELVTAKDTVATELDSSALLTTVPTVLASELVINPEQPSSNGSKTVEETQAVYTEPKAEVINLEPLKSNGAITVQESETVSAQPESAVMVATPSVAIDFSTLGSTLLAIVSEKTGYPAEMLDLEMDMEADLGIDSIKRVEILGGLQELYPDMPKPDNLEELAALRTLGQIAEYMQNLGQGSAQAQPASMEISSTVEVQQPVAVMPVTAVQETVIAVAEPAVTVTVAPPSPVVEPEVTVASPSPVTSDFSNLSSALLSIVSEKTGYPAEML
ncbi:MAG TPA: acyltransferase domain-containing protein, partial [Oculatellaceae cyanobacterium]